MSPARRLFGPGWSLRRSSQVPAYVQIEEQLAERIEAGEIAAGDRLPPERELARSLGVSRMTVRQALASLAVRGLVERGVGRGTFVAHPKLDHDLARVAGFTELVARHGLQPSAAVRTCAELPAPLPVAAALELAPGEPVVRLERVRFGGDVALALEDSWVPAVRFPGLAGHDLTGSLYSLMRDAYQLEPVRAVERLEPVLARRHEADALAVQEGSPLMLVERAAYAAGGVPVEFARDRYRGDRARFVVHVESDVLAGA